MFIGSGSVGVRVDIGTGAIARSEVTEIFVRVWLWSTLAVFMTFHSFWLETITVFALAMVQYTSYDTDAIQYYAFLFFVFCCVPSNL